ncbi:AIPR family protein, partial [Paracoccaceae bacterium]|nr:AIPR family protein [Paracoccaceae bacterium]
RYINKFQKALVNATNKLKQKEDEEEDFFEVEIFLIIAAKKLTDQAAEEFEEIKKNDVTEINGQLASIKYHIIGIDYLLGCIWEETNTDWKDRSGKNKVNCELTLQNNTVISDKNLKVFFARAYDLVQAYEDFGHRLFEANVRCQITRSPINEKIKEQVFTKKGIKEFYTLNNGVTIIAPSVSHKGKKVLFTKPGIVNGLQTVTSLHDAYHNHLSEEKKQIFEENCYVLVRAFEEKAVRDINKLVVATNNQNVMEARNLKSNEPEQIRLEKDCAELGWFYERKQFAWNAFASDPNNWPTLQRKRKSDFQIEKNSYRVMDNLAMAQSWLAFIGYTNEAMHRKGEIFSISNSILYEKVFDQRPDKHAYEFQYDLVGELVEPHIRNSVPSNNIYILSFVLHRAAKKLTPSPNKHREKMEKLLKITDLTKDERNSKLNKDNRYLVGLIKNTSTYIFVEMVGYILFSRYGGDIYFKMKDIIEKTDLKELFGKLSVQGVEEYLNQTKRERIEKSSFLLNCWLIFDDLIDFLVTNQSWMDRYHTASSRPRLIYSKETRKMIVEKIHNWHEMVQSGRKLDRFWSEHIENEKDFFKGLIDV